MMVQQIESSIPDEVSGGIRPDVFDDEFDTFGDVLPPPRAQIIEGRY
jgi:hypothetical protein